MADNKHFEGGEKKKKAEEAGRQPGRKEKQVKGVAKKAAPKPQAQPPKPIAPPPGLPVAQAAPEQDGPGGPGPNGPAGNAPPPGPPPRGPPPGRVPGGPGGPPRGNNLAAAAAQPSSPPAHIASKYWINPGRTRVTVCDGVTANPPALCAQGVPIRDLLGMKQADLVSFVYHDDEGNVLPDYYQRFIYPLLRKTYQLHHCLEAKQLKELQQASQDRTFLNGTSKSPHGFLAASREWFEDSIYRGLRKRYKGPGPAAQQLKVVDVGAGINRHHKAGRDIHALMPSLLPADDHRWSQWRRIEAEGSQGDLRACRHTIAECNCDIQGLPAMSIHSLYYLGARDILSFMVRNETPVLEALHHKFDLAGSFAEEAVYVTVDNWSTIEMHVAGNGQPYIHPRMEWLDAGFYVYGDHTLTWDSTRVGPSTLGLWRTTFKVSGAQPAQAIHGRGPQNIESLTDLLAPNREGAGIVGRKDGQFNALMATLFHSPSRWEQLLRAVSPWHRVEGEEYEVLFTGGVLTISRPDGDKVMVSRACAGEIATKLGGKAIGQNEVDAAVGLARQFFVHKVNVPITIGEDLLLPTVRLGLAMAIRRNTTHFTTLARFAGRLATANQLASTWMEPVKKEWPGAVMLIMAIVGLFAAANGIWTHTPVPRVLGFLVRMFFRVPAAATGSRGPKGQQRKLWWLLVLLAAVGSGFAMRRSAPVGGNTKPKRKYQPRYAVCCEDSVKLPPIGVGPDGEPLHSIRVDNDVPCQLQFGNVAIMRTIYREAQVVATSCPHNVAAALRVRLMAKDHVEVYTAMVVDLKAPEIRAIAAEFLAPVPFPDWVDRFEPPRRKVLCQIKDNLDRVGPTPEYYADRTIFIKVENYVKRGLIREQVWWFLVAPLFLVQLPLKPRPISNPNGEYLVRTGPITLAASQRLKKGWDGFKCRVLYASGRTPIELGALFDKVWNEYGPDLQFVEEDMANFDGSIEQEHYDYEFTVYSVMGMVKEHLDLLRLQAGVKRVSWMDRTSPGQTKVKAVVKAKRNSGDGNTSGGNSIVTQKTGCITTGRKSAEGFAFILGDDSLLLFPSDLPLPETDTMIKRAKSIGFDLEVVKGRGNHGTFCSGVFVPCTLEGKSTHIWASLPGRVLSKIGFCTKSYEHHGDPDLSYEKWMQGVLMGISRDYAFVPVVRTFVDKGLQIFKHPGVKPIQHEFRLHVDRDAWVDDNTLAWFSDRYDTDYMEIEDCESYICQWDGVSPLEHPLIEKMCNKDMPLDRTKAIDTPYFRWWPEIQSTLLKLKPALRRIWNIAPHFASMQSAVTLGEQIKSLEGALYGPTSLWWNLLSFSMASKHHTTLTALVADYVVLAPLVEEAIKEGLEKLVGRYAGATFGVWEWLINGQYKASPPEAIGALGPLALHSFVCTPPRSFWSRVKYHVGWNGVVAAVRIAGLGFPYQMTKILEVAFGPDADIADMAERSQNMSPEEMERVQAWLRKRFGPLIR